MIEGTLEVALDILADGARREELFWALTCLDVLGATRFASARFVSANRRHRFGAKVQSKSSSSKSPLRASVSKANGFSIRSVSYSSSANYLAAESRCVSHCVRFGARAR